jgi:hypothetical protein
MKMLQSQLRLQEADGEAGDPSLKIVTTGSPYWPAPFRIKFLGPANRAAGRVPKVFLKVFLDGTNQLPDTTSQRVLRRFASRSQRYVVELSLRPERRSGEE